MKLKSIVLFCVALVFGLSLFACTPVEHDPTDIKEYGLWVDVDAKYNEIELHWDENDFIHDSLRIDFLDDWVGYGQKSDFDLLDKHDLVYQYQRRTVTFYSDDTDVEVKFIDIDHENPVESTINIHISVIDLDIDSKLLIQDELMNDYYLRYDFNLDYYNYCYFKIAKDDVNQLKSGSFNEIRLDLVIITHIDGSKSFKLRTDDGIIEVGYYDNVGIYFNPELVN